MDRYTCMNCGHVCDPDTGELLRNLPAGIAFESIPPEWQCAACNVCSDDFRKV